MKLGCVRSEISRRGENTRWVRLLVITSAYELIAEPHDSINIDSSSLPAMAKGSRNTKRTEKGK